MVSSHHLQDFFTYLVLDFAEEILMRKERSDPGMGTVLQVREVKPDTTIGHMDRNIFEYQKVVHHEGGPTLQALSSASGIAQMIIDIGDVDGTGEFGVIHDIPHFSLQRGCFLNHNYSFPRDGSSATSRGWLVSGRLLLNHE